MSARDDLSRFDKDWEEFLAERERHGDTYEVLERLPPDVYEEALGQAFAQVNLIRESVRAKIIARVVNEARKTLEEFGS